MAKGFTFMLDSALAVMLAAIVLAGLYFMSSHNDDASTVLLLKKQAGDALAVLDKGGALASMNATQINSTLSSLLAPGVSWNLTAYYYNYSGGFSLDRTIGLGQGTAAANNPVAAARDFIAIQNASVSRYGIANLLVWSS